MSTGKNLPVTPDQIKQGLGGNFLSQLAGKVGVLPDAVSTQLSRLLRDVIDKLTPSGKIEIASERAAADGHPFAPIPHADQTTAADKLRVLSPASEWMLNSSYGNDQKIRRQLGKTVVLLNPREAEARGVADGASVELVNETGRLPLVVKTSPDVPVGVALVHKGRWPKHDPSHANVNVLNPGAKTDMGESSCVHAVEAELVPAKQ